MAEADAPKTDKKSPVNIFREKLRDKKNLEAAVLEGLKSTNAKVRSLAVKTAFKLKDHKVIKQHILPLIKSDKSKKVLRSVSDKITRKELAERVKKLLAAKKAPEKTAEAAPAEAAAAPAEKA